MAAFLPCRQLHAPAFGCSAPNLSALPDARGDTYSTMFFSVKVETEGVAQPGGR
jgi:hypothetical protein